MCGVTVLTSPLFSTSLCSTRRSPENAENRHSRSAKELKRGFRLISRLYTSNHIDFAHLAVPTDAILILQSGPGTSVWKKS